MDNVQDKKFSGPNLAQRKLLRVKKLVAKWHQHQVRPLKIMSIYPQEDPASILYTKLKQQDAQQAGIKYLTQPVSLQAGRQTWLQAIMQANQNSQIQAILVQKPSRQQYQQHNQDPQSFASWWQNLAEAIDPRKDIDGLAPVNLFKLEKKAQQVIQQEYLPEDNLDNYLLPATAQAVIDIAWQAVGQSLDLLRSKQVAVVGRSVIVGRPAVAGWQVLGVPVSNLGSKNDLGQDLRTADIIVSATGQSSLIKPNWIKEGAILIDVGAPEPEFDPTCYAKASFYTPVPYGVGPVTRACLLENLFKLV